MSIDYPSINLTEEQLAALVKSFWNYVEQTGEGTALPGEERAVPIEEAVAVLQPQHSTVE